MFSDLFFSSVRNASGRPEVRNARDAIDAYKNITDAINAAEAAANDAKTAADAALNVSERPVLSYLNGAGGDRFPKTVFSHRASKARG